MPFFTYALARPFLRLYDPETAHRIAIKALRKGLVGSEGGTEDPILATRLWDIDFANPIGLAAGFDKDAEVADALLRVGYGFVETGTVTPRPQPGNPKPRLFRLDEDEAVINRLGFNSGGLDAYAARLEARLGRKGIVGANVGKNRDTERAVEDYVIGIQRVAPLAQYLVVNISSPNTEGLRALQARQRLEGLLGQVLEARAAGLPDDATPPPLLVKVAPDLSLQEKRDIAEVALAAAVDGLIIGNTTVDRPKSLRSPQRVAAGGLSGKPLMEKSTECLADFYRLTEGRLPLVGCGGVSSGADAYAKIRAGASLVQLYTAMVFHGPGIVLQVKRELAACLRADGFDSLQAAVGAAHREAEAEAS